MNIEEIPREDLIQMLAESMFFLPPGDASYQGKSGYSLEVEEETSYRDILYRDAKLFPTPQEAIIHHWRKHYDK